MDQGKHYKSCKVKINIIDMLVPTCGELVFLAFLEVASCSPNDPKNQMRSMKEIKDYQYFHFFVNI